MADSAAVDAAVLTVLNGDATLMALMTDGAYFDVAKSGATKFVVVSQVIHEDDYTFSGSFAERFTFLVKAVERSASAVSAKTAAARIHTLLQDATLTVTGYGLMLCRRQERVRYTEVDDEDTDIRWQHWGGRYELWVSPS